MVALVARPNATTDSIQVLPPPEVRGAYARLPFLRDAEYCFEGPAGTAKTTMILHWIRLALLNWPGITVFAIRKTNVDLSASAMQTFQRDVLQPSDGMKPFSGNRFEPAALVFPNGSRVIPLGLDKPEKIKSKQANIAFINEATEITPEDLELVRSRLGRDNKLPFWQLLMDANPGSPQHWLNQRMNSGLTTRLRTFHRDNPAFWDARSQEWTPIGRRYVEETLAGLTGVRYQRLALGIWAAAEGTVYEGAWLPERNNPPRAAYTRGGRQDVWGDCGIPQEWPRYMAIDWGYRAPMSVQWWAIEPVNKAMILYREIYVTMRTVEEVAAEALAYMGWKLEPNGRLVQTRGDADPLPREIVADVDPGDRATWEAHFGLACFPATKGKDSISDGIQAVTARMNTGRLIVLQGSLVARDVNLDAKKKPCGFTEELDAYVWDTRGGRAPKETPMDDNDHAQDAARYLVQYFDRDTDTTGGYLDFHAPGY